MIDTGYFKLDGGAMFGVVPKVLWEKKIQPDSNNLCTWAMRCLLIEEGKRLILIDTGMGSKQSEKFFSHYYRSNTVEIKQAIQNAGYSPQEVTDVFLTHLHFDHCGGAVERIGNDLTATFPKATYWSNQNHWDWAIEPNARERASFLKENILPIKESGQLEMVENDGLNHSLPFEILFMDGHTEKQMLPKINYMGHPLVFMADLMPSVAHIPLPYVMGYDVRPLQTMAEKDVFMKDAAEKGYILFLEHDNQYECCKVKMGERGVELDATFQLSEL